MAVSLEAAEEVEEVVDADGVVSLVEVQSELARRYRLALERQERGDWDR